jgi:hypothetical protein
MRTTIVIPLFNAGELIAATLKCVFAQTSPAQVLLVDDGSTDNSVEIAQRFPNVRVVRNPGKGANAAVRFGADQAKSEFIALLDQDDLWHPEHLSRLEALLDCHRDAPAAFAGAVRFSGESRPTYSLSPHPPSPFDPWSVFPVNRICTQSQVLIRAAAHRNADCWSCHQGGASDVYAWLRLSAATAFIQSHDVTVGYRQHSRSWSATLRQHSRQAYFISFVEACTEALPSRLAQRPGDRQLLEARLAFGHALAQWTRTLESSSAEEAVHAARNVSRMLAEQPPAFGRDMFAQALYFAKGYSSVDGRARKALTLLTLAVKCPLDCGPLRRALLRRLWDREPPFHSVSAPPPGPTPPGPST